MEIASTKRESSMSPIRIRYSLSRLDLLRWQLYAVSHHRILVPLLVCVTTVLAVLELKQVNPGPTALAYKIGFVLFFDVVFLSVIVLTAIPILWLSLLIGRYRGAVGEHLLEITPDGLLERTSVNESLHRWASFHRIKETGKYLFLYVTDVAVHIVPKRCFASESDARAFQDQIRNHVNKDRGVGQP